MKLAAGLTWVAIVVISALLAALIHLPTFLSFPWSMATAALAYFICRSVDFSQFYGAGLLSRVERYRLPALIISLPLSLICLLLVNSFSGAWEIGLTATLVTTAIMISYNVRLKQ